MTFFAFGTSGVSFISMFGIGLGLAVHDDGHGVDPQPELVGSR